MKQSKKIGYVWVWNPEKFGFCGFGLGIGFDIQPKPTTQPKPIGYRTRYPIPTQKTNKNWVPFYGQTNRRKKIPGFLLWQNLQDFHSFLEALKPRVLASL